MPTKEFRCTQCNLKHKERDRRRRGPTEEEQKSSPNKILSISICPKCGAQSYEELDA